MYSYEILCYCSQLEIIATFATWKQITTEKNKSSDLVRKVLAMQELIISRKENDWTVTIERENMLRI